MCNYKFVENYSVNSKKYCSIGHYFSYWEDVLKYIDFQGISIHPDIKKLENTLPLDEKDVCIFHTKNLVWKAENNYSKKFQQLLVILNYLFEINQIEEIDLREIILIGINYQTTKHAEFQKKVSQNFGTKIPEIPKTIPLIDLKVNTRINLANTTFHDRVLIENSSLFSLNFSNSKFEKELDIQSSEFQEISFNGVFFGAGLSIELTKFSDYADFCHSIIKDSLLFTDVFFYKQALFIKTIFDTINNSFHCYFKSNTDFSYAQFHGITSFQECVFEKEVNFFNCEFTERLLFEKNTILDNVSFSAESTNNSFFGNIVDFKIQEEELKGKLIFENVNFASIVTEDRNNLLKLSHKNKVTIGKGCIKYRLQSNNMIIKINQNNQELILEFARTFINFFQLHAGYNLGIEIVDKQPDFISFFYFSDEDLSLEVFLKKLQQSENDFWDISPDFTSIQSVDTLASRMALFIKLQARLALNKWDDQDTYNLIQAINFNERLPISIENLHLSLKNSEQLNFLNIHNMNIKKIVSKDNSNINFNVYEKLEKIEYSSSYPVSEEEFITLINEIKQQLDSINLQEIYDLLILIKNSENHPENSNRKNTIQKILNKHGVAIGQSLSASTLFEVLKNIFI